MATQYPEGFVPIQKVAYPEGFVPISYIPVDQTEVAPASAPLTEYEQFKEQVRSGLPQSALGAAGQSFAQPFKLAGGLAGGLAHLVKEGAQGVGTIFGKGSVEGTTLSDLTQTALETVPRFALEGLGAPIRQAVEFSAQEPRQLARNITDVTPLNAAINYAIRGAEPSEEEFQRMFERYKQSQIQSKVFEQPIVPEVFGETNIDVARATPLLIGSGGLPGAIEASLRALPNVARQVARTAGTIVSSPRTLYRAGGMAEPFISGKLEAGAQGAVDTALARQASLQNEIARSIAAEQGAEGQALARIASERSEAAVKGREALASGRELRTAQGTITPEIVQAQTSLAEAAELPVVILSKNAIPSEAEFGQVAIKALDKPIKASEGAYTGLYNEVQESLPSTQLSLPAQALYDAAQQGKMDLSQGFEAFNKGVVKKILDESTTLTKTKSLAETNPELISIYESASESTKARMLQQYPELASPRGSTSGTIPEYSWTELQQRFRQINQGINDALKYGNSNDARILGNLKDGIVKSMETYAEQMGPETFNLFRQANKAYAEHQNKFGLNRIQTLFKDDVLQNPELVAQKLITYDNPSQVEAIKLLVSPEEFSAVQARFAQKLLSPNANVPFEPSHFVKQYSSRGARETVKAVFGESGLNDFNQLNQASLSFAKIEDLQKTLDTLATRSDKAMEAFKKAKSGVSESERLLADKNALKAQLKAFDEIEVRNKVASADREVQLARKELDSIKNYRQLKDWATRVSGLNIVGAAARTPDWARLLRYAALHTDVAVPEPSP